MHGNVVVQEAMRSCFPHHIYNREPDCISIITCNLALLWGVWFTGMGKRLYDSQGRKQLGYWNFNGSIYDCYYFLILIDSIHTFLCNFNLTSCFCCVLLILEVRPVCLLILAQRTLWRSVLIFSPLPRTLRLLYYLWMALTTYTIAGFLWDV